MPTNIRLSTVGGKRMKCDGEMTLDVMFQGIKIKEKFFSVLK